MTQPISFVLGVFKFNGARANSTNAELEVADILTSQKIAGGSVGPSWTPVSVPACFIFYFLGVVVDVT